MRKNNTGGEIGGVAVPSFGSTWLHTSGTVYCVVGDSNQPGHQGEGKKLYPFRIHYVDEEGFEFSGDFDDWYRRMKPISRGQGDLHADAEGRTLREKAIKALEAARLVLRMKQQRIEHVAFMEAE